MQLIIIDNLNTTSGRVDENTAAMGTLMSNFRRLAEMADAAVVPIHHQRKGNNDNGGYAGDNLRGHSSINASLDLALQVQRDSKVPIVTVKSTKTRGQDVVPFKALFTFEAKEDGELQSARFYGVSSNDSAKAFTSAPLEQAILEIVGENKGINQSKLKELVKAKIKASDPRISEVTDRLADEKRLTVTIGSRNAHLYSLPD